MYCTNDIRGKDKTRRNHHNIDVSTKAGNETLDFLQNKKSAAKMDAWERTPPTHPFLLSSSNDG
jgi:hypothetical protein